MKPLAIDLYCGLGGWTEGLLAEGYDPIGFDIERHVYGDHRYPAQLVVQDVRSLHGSQVKTANLIVASPPCQKYSYMAQPWTRAKDLARWYREPEHPERIAELNELFEACFRIQREAIEAAGHHIPLVVENVQGARPWVGTSTWHHGSFHLWGDIPALMPIAKAFKSSGMNWSDQTKRGQDFTRIAGQQAMEGIKGVPHCTAGHWTNPAEHEGIKVGGGASGWFGKNSSPMRQNSSDSKARKFASAMIAKIPEPLSRHIAATYHPDRLR